MAVVAKDAEPGKIYRLTRDSGSTYYKICDDASVRRLEKRLGTQNPRFMKPADRLTLQALGRCRSEGYVLAVRVLRFRTEHGVPRETKAYVAFPPDYALREVEKPPGYTAGNKKPKSVGTSRGGLKSLDTGSDESEDPGERS